ncbi:MAG: DUF4159 domain-containing protein [Phycisphaerales bacterium JB063]
MHKLYQLFVIVLAIVASAVCFTPQAQAQQLTDEEVTEGINKIKEYLFASQDASGAWFGSYQSGPNDGSLQHQWGETAMAVLALIVSGESPQRPEIQKALELLAEVEIQGVYPLSMRTHVWSYLPERFKPLLNNDGSTMLASAYQGARFNYFVYGTDPFNENDTRIDNSTTQYGILALWQVAKRGGRIPAPFWEAAVRNFIEMQKNDGGWAYSTAPNTTQSMTCAGLAVLLVAQQELFRDRDTPEPNIQAAINKGFGFLDRNYNIPQMDTHSGANYTYYGYERVALASGRKYFAGQDWFSGIAHVIVQRDARYGNSVHQAAFDLMFLARGRVPVWINKLQIDGAEWNNRPNDVYFLNRYISDYIETEVNWQIVDINTHPDEWMNAPLMWLSSPRAIEFTDEQVAKIKQYLDMGGTLIVNPENRSSAMRDSVLTLAERMYPHLAFTDMEATHPMARLVSGEPRARRGPPIKVLNNGARDLIILPQQDWGMEFQRDTNPDASEDEHWRYITNIYAVVTDRGKLTPRLSSPLVAREQRPTQGTIKVVTATIGDTPLPETDVYSAMRNVVFNASGYDLLVEQMPLADIAIADPTLVHLIGVHATQLSPEEQSVLQSYIESGGTVLVETLGGRSDFASTVGRQLATGVGGQDELLRNSIGPIINGRGLPEGSVRNSRVIFRPLTIELADPGTNMLLRGIRKDDRFPVLISNEDLSLGMLGVRQYGINGYSVESARNIMLNVLLEAEKAHPGSDEPTVPAGADTPGADPDQTAPAGE